MPTRSSRSPSTRAARWWRPESPPRACTSCCEGIGTPPVTAGWPEAWPGPGLRLLHLGRLEERKRPGLAIDTLAALRRSGGDASLVLAGEGPQSALAARAAGLPVRFVGRVSDADKWRLYDSADVLLFGSTLEGFGLVVAEAQSRGVPVVAAAGTATAEALEDGRERAARAAGRRGVRGPGARAGRRAAARRHGRARARVRSPLRLRRVRGGRRRPLPRARAVKALCSIGSGPHEALLEVSRPTFAAYAERHGYELLTSTVADRRRPPAWAKVPMLREAVESFELVLWIDADAVIVDGGRDVADELEAGSELALVRHGEPQIPNTGVLLLRGGPRSRASCWIGVWRRDAVHPTTRGGRTRRCSTRSATRCPARSSRVCEAAPGAPRLACGAASRGRSRRPGRRPASSSCRSSGTASTSTAPLRRGSPTSPACRSSSACTTCARR